MRRLREILEFLMSLVNAWKTLLPLIFLALSTIIAVLKFGNTIVTFSLPVWAILIVGVLALYPIAKLVEYGLKQGNIPPVKLYGLLWKAPFLPFRYPVPLCPHNDCRCEVICKRIPPPPIQHVTNLSDLNNRSRFESQYVYECPVHGKINGVPNEDISLLQHKARLAMRKWR